MTEAKPWFILLTEPNREITATSGLVGRGFRAYGPTVYKRVASGRRDGNGNRKMRESQRPMFPGYIFVQLNEGKDDFGAPVKVAGVRDYLRFDGLPCSLSCGLVETIAEREASEFDRYQDSIKPRVRAPFSKGERVVIVEGPFRQFLAKVEDLDDRGRVTLLLSLFGRQTRTVVEGSQVEAA